MNDAMNTGSFTLPGEAGHEELTLRLADRWGADAIRDSDGTALSDRILSADYDIYSTLCLVRADNQWARVNRDKLQQNYLMSFPVVADGDRVEIELLAGYFREQFEINSNDDPKRWWQVFDRTTGTEIPKDRWTFEPERGTVVVSGTRECHTITANFLAYRIWEEISMYNHVTNDWGDREHLMPVDPIHPEVQQFMLEYLRKWLDEHPRTKVVRFTSLFYNFAWFWGDPAIQRFVYGDWGSYEMTVSPRAMQLFAQARGYEMTSEDFVNAGSFCSSHTVPSSRLLDWMDFVNEFVVDFGRQCVDVVHAAGKEAYLFYDDHWVGTEPYGERFTNMGFDGLIKCVFNAFEARLCSGVEGVPAKEIRLHPYLFPTGLKGEPTFSEGGTPAHDARRFWANIRRGLLREPVGRIGLGGYLHLVEDYPEFIEAIEDIAGEFRTIKRLHAGGAPYTAPVKVAVLTAWGMLRSWVYVGHFIPGMELYEVTESLAGLPVEVTFVSFADILERGIPADVDVVINAGRSGTAWSGGEHWKNEEVIETLTAWVAAGGGLVGVGEPSALRHSSQYFQLSHVLGVDREIGLTLNRNKLSSAVDVEDHFIVADAGGDIDLGEEVDAIFKLQQGTQILARSGGSVRIAVNTFGEGRSVYLSGFRFDTANTRLLHRALFWAAEKQGDFGLWGSSNPLTDCAYFPSADQLVVINNGGTAARTTISGTGGRSFEVEIAPLGLEVVDV
jgi:beta-D-galactosyl-(1->4)-L-rhamnose phosphorylase